MIHYLSVIKTMFIAITLSCVLSLSAHAVEPDGDSAVSQNFKKVGRSFRGIRNAKTAAELLPIFQGARSALANNKNEVPSFMESGTDQYQDFIDGIDDALSRIDKAIALAEADDYKGALAAFANVRDAKDEYHEKFELESGN